MKKCCWMLGLILWGIALPGYAQLSPEEELNFALEVKQIDEFIERFNFDRSTLLLQYLARNYPEMHWERADLLRSLFNSEGRDWDTTQIETFIQQVTHSDRPVTLGFYQKGWFAELECNVVYNGKQEKPTLILEIHTEPDLAAKWTIRGVRADFLKISQENKLSFLNPISHSTDFMGLRKAMGDTANLPNYTFEAFEPDMLSIFMYELQKGTLKFQQVNHITYHFLQIDNWILQVRRYLRPSRNSGWLIDSLIAASLPKNSSINKKSWGSSASHSPTSHCLMKKLPLYLFGILFCTISQGIAQEEVTTRDKVEITYRAEQMVQELNDLMNVLTFSDVFDSEIKTLIENSTAASNNQLFFDPQVIIEDDIDPRNVDHTSVKDREVVDYLQELNLSYQKADDYTIQFMGFEVSQVYEKNYPYVLVKFQSQFSSQHKSIAQPYQTTTRVAEIRAVKEDDKWNTYISRIAFFDPTSEFTVADYETEGMPPMLAAVDTTGLDEAQKRILLEQERQRREQQAALAEIRAEVQRLAEKEKREEQQREEVSERLIQEGDEAFAVGDFETALQAYDESKRVNPYQTVAFQKINAVNKAIADEKAKLRQAELRYEDLTTKGKYAYRIREFDTAITLLKGALELRPRSEDIAETIREIEKVQLDVRRYGEKERTNDYTGAIRDYTRAIKEQPENAALYVARARCYEMTQKSKKAFEDYSKAIELYDEYHIAHQKRGDINFANQEYALAENDYSRAISLKKEDPPLLIKRSKVRQLLGDLPKAIEDYSAAIRQRPTNGQFYLDRGHLYLKTQQKEKAFEDFSSSLTLSPELYDAWFQRGWLSIEKNNIEDASSDFARAKKEGLSDQDWQRVVSQGQVYYQSGLNTLNQGQHEAAVGHLTNAVTVDPDFAPAWFARAQAQEKQQAYREAVSDYSSAIKRDPNYAEAYFRRGVVKASREEYEAAALDFGEATRIQPNMLQAHVAQAEAYTELKQPEDAIKAYQAALIVDPKRADLYYAAGLLHLELEQYARTVASLDQAVRYDKSMAEGFYHRGVAKHAQNLFPQAIKDFSQAAKLRPTYGEAYLARARSQRDMGKGKKAVPDYQLAISQGIDPEWEAQHEMGLLQYDLGEYQGAVSALEKARELNPQLVGRDLLMALGNANLQLNAWDKSQTYFEEILVLDQNSHQAKFGLARLYAGKGLATEANQYLEEVLASGAQGYSLDLIKKDPFLKLLKKDPGQKAILDKYF